MRSEESRKKNKQNELWKRSGDKIFLNIDKVRRVYVFQRVCPREMSKGNVNVPERTVQFMNSEEAVGAMCRRGSRVRKGRGNETRDISDFVDFRERRERVLISALTTYTIPHPPIFLSIDTSAGYPAHPYFPFRGPANLSRLHIYVSVWDSEVRGQLTFIHFNTRLTLRVVTHCAS